MESIEHMITFEYYGYCVTDAEVLAPVEEVKEMLIQTKYFLRKKDLRTHYLSFKCVEVLWYMFIQYRSNGSLFTNEIFNDANNIFMCFFLVFCSRSCFHWLKLNFKDLKQFIYLKCLCFHKLKFVKNFSNGII